MSTEKNLENAAEKSHFFPEGLPTQKNTTNPKKALKPSSSENQWFWGNGDTFKRLKEDAALASSKDIVSLIIGETGSGKEVVAREIHKMHTAGKGFCSKEAPFVSVNCAAIPEALSESILFGHERGAFTSARERKYGKFETAQKGSLFLDEIQNMDKEIQSKLLRVIQDRKVEPLGAKTLRSVECKLIAATNIPLEILVEKGLFRKDLFYRLNVCPLYIPALRHRKEDLLTIIEGLQEKLHRELGLEKREIDHQCLETLKNHSWPGNIRELEHALIFASMRSNKLITIKELPGSITGQVSQYLKKGIWDLNGCFKALS